VPSKSVEYYKINAEFLIRKDYWHLQFKKVPSVKFIQDKIQEGGIEVPIEDVKVKITE